MARDAVAITALGIDAATNAMAGVAITAANGVTLAAAGNTGRLLLEIINTTAAEKVITVVAPTDNPHAVRASLGNLAITFAAGNSTPVVKYVVLESARFAQTSGAIHVDFAADTTGFVRAYRLPRGS
jgi:L-asparagine transporter-like permease